MSLAEGTGGRLTELSNEHLALNLNSLAFSAAEYTDKNIDPYEEKPESKISENAAPSNVITSNIGSTGYKISYTKAVSFNGVSHIEAGGKTSKKKAGDIEIKLFDPSGSEVTSGYKVKFKNNKNPLNLSTVTLDAKKASETKIKGLAFTNETGAKIKLKQAKGSKGDFTIKAASGDSILIVGQGNYTGEGRVPAK